MLIIKTSHFISMYTASVTFGTSMRYKLTIRKKTRLSALRCICCLYYVSESQFLLSEYMFREKIRRTSVHTYSTDIDVLSHARRWVFPIMDFVLQLRASAGDNFMFSSQYYFYHYFSFPITTQFSIL